MVRIVWLINAAMANFDFTLVKLHKAYDCICWSWFVLWKLRSQLACSLSWSLQDSAVRKTVATSFPTPPVHGTCSCAYFNSAVDSVEWLHGPFLRELQDMMEVLRLSRTECRFEGTMYCQICEAVSGNLNPCVQAWGSTLQAPHTQARSVRRPPSRAWMWTLRQTATMTLRSHWLVLEVMRSWWNCCCLVALTSVSASYSTLGRELRSGSVEVFRGELVNSVGCETFGGRDLWCAGLWRRVVR
jgi:hypothetical protein